MTRDGTYPIPPDPGRYGPTLEVLPHLAWVAGPDGSLEYLNRRCMEYAGLPLDDLLGWDWEWVIHPADLAHTLASWNNSLLTGTPLATEYRLRRADGRYRWFAGRAFPVRGPDGKVVRWFGTCTDIDESKRSEASLRVTETHFRALIERSPDGHALIGSDGEIRYTNPAVTDLLGLLPGVVIGTNAADWTHPDDRPQIVAHAEILLEKPGGRTEAAIRFRHRNGSYIWFDVRATNLLPDPDVRAVAITFRPDIAS